MIAQDTHPPSSVLPHRIALLLCAASWGIHFVSVSVWAIGANHAGLRLWSCLVTCWIGVALCMLAHRVLRVRKATSGLRMFGRTAALCAVFAAVHTLLDRYVYMTMWSAVGDASDLWTSSALLTRFVSLAWIYMAWSGLYAAGVAGMQLRLREQELATAAFAAQRAQLFALRLQVSPHFLFNTLNTLSGLVALRRLDECEHMILNLSGFLRQTLAVDVDREVELAAEVESVGRYLDIERLRYAQRLVVSYAIDDAARGVRVPELILLPLVENAVKHAFDSQRRQVQVRVSAHIEENHLRVTVEDDGQVSGAAPERPGLGIGLRNVRLRLSTLYGDAAHFDAAATPKGWRSTFRLPAVGGFVCAS